MLNEESHNILSVNDDTQSNMKSPLRGDNLLELMKGQQIQNSRFKRIHLPDSDWIESAVNYGTDSDLTPNTKRNGSNSTTKPSYLLSSSSPPLQISPNNQQDLSSQSPGCLKSI